MAGFGGARQGAGRPKGVPNKDNAAVKKAILEAFDKLGGVDYLVNLGRENPKVFGVLLGKVIPQEVALELRFDHMSDTELEQRRIELLAALKAEADASGTSAIH